MERKKKTSEIIGEKIRIIKSLNSTLVGITGRVIEETKNMMVLKTEHGIKKIIKSQVTFEMNGKKYNGKEMVGRFIDRITGA